jgi:TatD DNase family protein
MINKKNLLIDSHAHLDMLLEEGADLDEIIQRAKENNVNIIQSVCSSILDFPKILKITEKYEGIYASVGLHPENLHSESATTAEKLIKLSKHPKVISIGETGLDYHYKGYDKELQRKNFEQHIEASRKTKLPLIIHTRDADKDMQEILESETKNGKFPFLLHCYTSGKELAFKGLDLGGYISISGVITFKNTKELQDLVKKIPLDRLMVETDAPFLAPVPHRGKCNEPAYVKYTAEYLAELKNVSYDEIRKVTTNNFLKLFNKVEV